MKKSDLKIVSGGQTGADQAGLHAAIDLSLEWGGHVPKGWRTENDPLNIMYRSKMHECCSPDYVSRTKQNVQDSDATLILVTSMPLSGGTKKTKNFCTMFGKPHCVAVVGQTADINKVQTWLADTFNQSSSRPFKLNIAGPRESKARGIQKRARKFLVETLKTMLET